MKRILSLSLIILLAITFAGCASPPPPAGELKGVVAWQTKATGEIMVAGVTVNVWGNNNTRVASAVTDATGHYKIANIPPGQGYLITCHQAQSSNTPEKNWLFANINITSGGSTQVDMSFDNALKGGVLPDVYQ